MSRVFVGLKVPDEIASTIATIRAPLPGVRWLGPETLHLTLEFIGEVADRNLERLQLALAEIDGRECLVEGTAYSVFPRKARPRALCLGLKPSEGLLELHVLTRQCLQVARFVVSDRPFRPHVTVARLKAPPQESIEQAVAAVNSLPRPTFTATALSLFESRLSPNGVRYDALSTVPLASATAPTGS